MIKNVQNYRFINILDQLSLLNFRSYIIRAPRAPLRSGSHFLLLGTTGVESSTLFCSQCLQDDNLNSKPNNELNLD